MKAARAHRVSTPATPEHLYAFKRGDSTTLWCVPCRSSHWIVLAIPAYREMTLATLRERGELEDGL